MEEGMREGGYEGGEKEKITKRRLFYYALY